MDARTLWEVMGKTLPLARYEQLLPAYERMLSIVGARSVTQCAMIAAQLGHESVGLKYQEEIASGAAYEWRKDLGNVYPGDGVRFKGHGWIQVTGRHNHTTVSQWAHQRGIVPTPTYFVDTPQALGADAYCWVGPAWYLTAARPGFMAAADRGDLDTCTRMINGGTNGLADRRRRWNHALTMGTRLLPGKAAPVIEKVLDYPRDQVTQDTYYNCGPASAQTIIRAETGRLLSEVDLGVELGTHRGGTDWIGQFPAVLNRHLPGAQYRSVEMPNDPPTTAQKDRLWRDIVASIDAGHGVVANIVAPPSNYPRAVAPSTIHPAYSGGTVYHYVALMGYADDGRKRVWVADSGFRPFGYWISFDQLATLIPPKGYAYSAAPAKMTEKKDEDPFMALTDAEQRELLDKTRDIWTQLRGRDGAGWPQLGQNEQGQDLTLVDGVAAARLDIARLKETDNG